ncbi:LacI family DNA-binding transcriptional regulator [Halomonas sp. MCCC 1A17488]|uniref:LacI family DNA-binding transcriptional regulator n=1 Tax=unclassified Halomonas TaxID=2609666 RepID=UPI0018D23F82|nr:MULTISPECIES: LacI family DNA-binding transcriptional regulator [unclassified Halomonas]MCE8014842.1 LacI family DNA-binding transcriptional regulator [Halomonas sp. MCCC 1A17488]MCG3238175.1 LacI family DNA-binding transcriptional regulator [Halomonas sp. MCCC 1A17488]QPP48058.1 LacI family DNA-binding transcriptional regulator [Halomonas sp. SS10-MC5]
MKRKSVTSRDVAKLAGVSQSAVSRSFSSDAKVAEKTRKKVMAAARELGYRPNSIARSLITRSSRTIAVVTYSLDNPFYAFMLEKASRFFQQQGYHLLLFFAPSDRGFDTVIDEIIRSQVEGVLLLAITLDNAQAEEVADFGIPVVIINRTVNYAGISQVGSDNFSGGYWAGQHLASLGHRRIAYLAGLPDSSTDHQRHAGFIEGLATMGAACHASEVGNYRYTDACDATRRLFAAKSPPDALFCANDVMAIAAMETMRHEFGLMVPNDVSVIGFDDVPMASWPSHSLTTLQQPVDQMIMKATELLMGQIHQTDTIPEHVTLPVTPKLRSSTQRLARGTEEH